METIQYNSAKQKIDLLVKEIETVIIGKGNIIQLAITALLADGHVLFEDIPGVGKTLLVKTLAKAIQCRVNRVQFTPDLLPSDIVGVSIFNRQRNEFEFKEGPIFTDMLLADEINRTTPRSQAALLEAMSEGQITTDGNTYLLSSLFFVLATQNPTDYEGTYPLPEAQLDRFLFRLSIGYPTFQEEVALLSGEDRQVSLKRIKGVVTKEEIVAMKQLVQEVYVDPALLEYAVDLVRSSRHHPDVRLGISPRGALSFVRAAKAFGLTEGRSYCVPDDFMSVMEPVFSHRLILHEAVKHDEKANSRILSDIRSSVKLPVRI